MDKQLFSKAPFKLLSAMKIWDDYLQNEFSVLEIVSQRYVSVSF